MIPHDYHIHSDFSCDCEFSMMEMCRGALERGLSEIGFSEHFDLLPADPCYNFFKAEAWWEALESCREMFRPALTIRAGIELGEPHRYPNEMKALLDAHPWDYCLGSLHWVGDQLIFDQSYFETYGARSYPAYFEELGELAAAGSLDILAHLDIVKRYGVEYAGPFELERHETVVREVLRTCAQRGIALEVNTSTLRRGMDNPSPQQILFEWFAEEGGEWVTLGSDAHRPEHIGAGLEQAAAMLRSAGFEQVARFERRQPRPASLPVR